jgi:acetylornithine deacetylase
MTHHVEFRTVMQTPSLISMLGTLVAEPSVSCTASALDQGNRRVVEHLAGWLEALDFEVEVVPLPEKTGKANLIATLGSGSGGLVLAGHTDTVPFDENLWTHHPFRLTERDDRLYGLGTCDMKGFFPLVIEAVKRLDARNLRRPLTIIATADEETSMAGARHLAASGRPHADFAVIGEPTSMRPVIGHKGFTALSIVLHGASGHSSDPALGRNALDAMQAVMAEVIAYRNALAERYRDPAFDVAVPTVNLGCLRAGDNPNRICGHAELQIDIRMLPGMDQHEVHDALRVRLERVAALFHIPLDVREINPPVPAFATPSDSQLVRRLERASGQRAGTVAFCTEGPFMQQLGMETVIFGAGNIAQAHQPDEFLARDQIEPAVDVLAHVIHDVCISEAGLARTAAPVPV